jgi:hypothetical protein
VQGNLIGTDAAGGGGLGNATGVRVESGVGNRIGGIAQNAPNIISGNTNFGVELVGPATTDTTVAGNRIGTDPAGTVARANGTGISVDGGASHNTIGGTSAEARNEISGNTALGVRIDAPARPQTQSLATTSGRPPPVPPSSPTAPGFACPTMRART